MKEFPKNSTLFEDFVGAIVKAVTTDTTPYNIIYEKWFTATIYNVYLTAF